VGKTKDGKEGEGGGLSYTIVNCGVIFDLSLGKGPISIPERFAEILDGGDHLFSASRLSTIGKAVVAILTHFEESKNRQIYIQDIVLSQNLLLVLAQRYTKGERWTIKKADTEELVKESDEKLKNGADPTEFWLRIQYIKKVVYSGTCKAVLKSWIMGY